MSRYDHYLRVGKAFAEELKTRPDVLGVILAGSWLEGDPDLHADIDIPVILHPDAETRQRGNLWREGIEIEYLENSPQQIRAYFRQETKSPHTAHMLAHGIIAWQRDPVVADLIEEAQTIWKKGPEPVSKFGLKMARYRLDDWQKDLADARAKGDEFGASLVRNQIVNLCIQHVCLAHGQWPDKNKRVSRQLAQIDSVFHHLLTRFAAGDNPAAGPLFDRMESYLQGKRGQEWFLQGPLDLD